MPAIPAQHWSFEMPVSISIEPLAPSIEMIDSPDTCSAYSLSGHIAISVTAGSSVLGVSCASPQNFLLSSLEITFEGQSELLNDAGYASLRIISITKELVSPSHPLQICRDNDCAEWRVIFNLAVPGWLPASSMFGDDNDERTAGVDYALYASARFISASSDVDDGPFPAVSNNFSHCMWNSLCSFVRLGLSYPKVVHAARVPICLTRYVSPPLHAYNEEEILPPSFPRALFAVKTAAVSTADETLATNIPTDVLGSVQLHVIVPSRTSVDDDSVTLALRLRRRARDADAQNQLKVLRFNVNVVQVEEYHTTPPSSYTTRFPLPPPEQQPPLKPLKSRHPLGALFEIGLVSDATPNVHVLRERSLIPEGASTQFDVHEADSTDLGVSLEDDWLRLEVGVPVSSGLKHQRKRVTGQSPFLDVRHEMQVRLTVGYEQAGGDAMVSDELLFVVPLEFVIVMPHAASPHASTFFPMLEHNHAHPTSSLPPPVPPMSPSTPALSHARSLPSLHHAAQSPPPSHPPIPFPPPLPAYSQLFYENGDRKDEFLGALPVYREKVDAPLCGAADTSLCMSTSTLTLASSSTMSHTESQTSGSIPHRTSLESLDSPISSDLPVTPPGLAGCYMLEGAKPEQKFDDGGLRCDEGRDAEGDEGPRGPVGEYSPEDEVDSDVADVQFGIAF